MFQIKISYALIYVINAKKYSLKFELLISIKIEEYEKKNPFIWFMGTGTIEVVDVYYKHKL